MAFHHRYQANNTESKQVFSEAQESELESCIKKAADIYFGLSPKDV